MAEITRRLKEAKYFSVAVDSTPDEGHIDQLAVTVRYMEDGKPVERFVTCVPNNGHKSTDMYAALKNFLNEYGINLGDCRGQSYDNAANMTGKYRGMQTLMQQEFPLVFLSLVSVIR